MRRLNGLPLCRGFSVSRKIFRRFTAVSAKIRLGGCRLRLVGLATAYCQIDVCLHAVQGGCQDVQPTTDAVHQGAGQIPRLGQCFQQHSDCICWSPFIHFASAAVAVDSSRMTVSSSASCSRFRPPSNSVNGHVSTMWFMVCRWP